MVVKSSSVKSLAVFIDFENLALGFQGRNDRFEIKLVLTRLLEKGKIVAKKAYADWHRFSFYTGSLHEAAIELVEIPRRAQTGKNSADIRLCVDAMDLAYSKEHIDTFVIVSGDSDFSPLVSKLKELGKHVIGLGMTNSTSNLLRDNCDEFIYYEDLTQAIVPDIAFKPEMSDQKRKPFLLLAHAYSALRRDNREIIHSSTLKETMRRMKPSFNENYHGYRSFSQLLEDAQREGLLTLAKDPKSGTYVVTSILATIEDPLPLSASRDPQTDTFAPSSGGPVGEYRDDQNIRNDRIDRNDRNDRNGRNRRRHRGPRRPEDLRDQNNSENPENPTNSEMTQHQGEQISSPQDQGPSTASSSSPSIIHEGSGFQETPLAGVTPARGFTEPSPESSVSPLAESPPEKAAQGPKKSWRPRLPRGQGRRPAGTPAPSSSSAPETEGGQGPVEPAAKPIK